MPKQETRRGRWIPGWRGSPEGRDGNPLQYSCLENPMDRGVQRPAVHGVAKESDRTEQLADTHTHTHTHSHTVYRLLLLLQLSRFRRVWLCATPQTAAHQAPLPWDSPGRNTGVGCHCLLQCMKVKSDSEVAHLCPTLCVWLLATPWTAAHQGPPSMGVSRREHWSGCHRLLWHHSLLVRAAPNPFSLSTSHYWCWKTKPVLSTFFLRLETSFSGLWDVNGSVLGEVSSQASSFPVNQSTLTSKFFYHWKQQPEQKQPFCNYEESSDRFAGLHC